MPRDIRIASLDIRASDDITVDVVADSLARRGVLGVVGVVEGRTAARAAVNDAGDVLVSIEGRQPTVESASGVVESLAGEWSADVTLESDVCFVAASARPEPTRDAEMPPRRRVYVIGGGVTGDPARRPDFAAQLEASVSVIAIDGRWVLQAHGEPQDYWPSAQRPVVAVTAVGDSLTVELWSRDAMRGAVGSPDAQMLGIPNLTFSWQARWRPVSDARGQIADIERMLGRGRQSSSSALGRTVDRDAALAELGAERNEIEETLTRDNDDALIDAVVGAFRLPTEVGRIVRGTVDIDALPGAEHVERTPAGRMVWRQLHPARRDSVWARWRRRFSR